MADCPLCFVRSRPHRETEMSDSQHRSFERIDTDHLHRLAALADADLENLFNRRPQLKTHRDRCVLMCLCQGAAQHFVDGKNGIKDFDVWAFFRSQNSGAFPPRRRGTVDFGPSPFGRDPDEGQRFSGRRVDVMGRSLEMIDDEGPVSAVQRYLTEGRTTSARLLAERPVIAIWPEALLGAVVWPPPRQD